ncbi:transcriptional regulator [Lactobacillus selangorensis]|uniref:Transcriptional regulator n=1 Tax=Lactobacillus selangorensis TaxID=81857 RepID=A0A0R2G0E8_9LACO|nr:TetR/AcrR family transcriptional regulator [Lactobacillus selangorensis]KRN28704.1 transcriptional regulator [Lactobacillus selangorensis]KRN32886.1 transcriptional regulator [Lactobacillus selangorensis]
MRKHNQHWQATQLQLQTIVFELLKTTPAAEITVSQVCQLAHINRSTFYAHFADVYELIESTETSKRQELINRFMKRAKTEKMNFLNQASIVYFLEFIKENGWFYKIVLHSCTEFPIQEGFAKLYQLLIEPLKQQRPDLSDEELLLYFVAYQASFTMILKRWSEEDYQLAPPKVAQVMLDALPYVIHKELFAEH